MKLSLIIFVLLLIVGGYLLFASLQHKPSTLGTQSTITPIIGQRTKTSDCQVNGALQDSACTPGTINPSLTADVICNPSFSTKSVRNVPASEKKRVYDDYGITQHRPGEYEVDHLISLELGGSNDIGNLWPEAAEPRPGFHEKDMVENYLHKQVCDGKLPLQQAQQQIATNWLQIYNSTPNIKQYQYAPTK